MSEKFDILQKPVKKESVILSPSSQKLIQEHSEDHFIELTKNSKESQGLLYFPKECIKIIPGKDGKGGVIEFWEPKNKIGIETFQNRDKFEKSFLELLKIISLVAEKENQIFSGEKNSEPFHPEIGGRICFTVIKVYETSEGVFVSMPVIPNTGQRYSGHGKFASTNLVRGVDKFNFQKILGVARSKETNTLESLQKENPREKIISEFSALPAGIWTVRIFDQKGRPTTLNQKFHISRDKETGTFEIFSIEKQQVFQEFKNLSTKENLPEGVERYNTLVDLEDLKKAEKGKPIKLEKIYYEGNQILHLSEIPEKDKTLFEEKDGAIFLKEFKPVPPLEAFRKSEQRIIDENSDAAKKKIKDTIGEKFEKIILDLLKEKYGTNKTTPENQKNKKVENFFHTTVPREEELKNLFKNLPQELAQMENSNQLQEFKAWAFSWAGQSITTNPDFVLPDGTFVEIKAFSEDKDQLFRMVLQKILEKKPIKIQIITFGNSRPSRNFPFIQIQDIKKTEFAEQIEKNNLLKEVEFWQSKL